jgi:hypothetical protein
MVEMEDLRELHYTYIQLDMPVDRTPTALKDPRLRMTLLLEGCIATGLSEEDRRKLGHIVFKSKGFDRISNDGIAPFDVFMNWMKEIFSQGIGGLYSSSSGASSGGPPTEAELVGRRGFVAAMLREQAREIRKQQEQQKQREQQEKESAQPPPAEPESQREKRRHSYREAAKGQPRKSESRSGSVIRKHRSTLVDDRTTAQHRRHSGQPEVAMSRKRSTSIALRGSKSTPSSRRSSGVDRQGKGLQRASSRLSNVSNRSEARSREPSNTPTSNAEPQKDVIQQGNLFLAKGLPNSDAMLRHKAYRAPSVDMTGNPDLMRHRLSVQSVAAESISSAAARARTQPRKQKSGLDAGIVITDTISRLEKTQMSSPPAALKGIMAESLKKEEAEVQDEVAEK